MHEGQPVKSLLEVFRDNVSYCLTELEGPEIRAIIDTCLRWVKIHPQLVLSDPVIEQFRSDCNFTQYARFASRVCMLSEVKLGKSVYDEQLVAIVKALNCHDSQYTLPVADEPVLGLHSMVDRVLGERLAYTKLSDEQITSVLITIVLANRFLQFALLLSFSSAVIDLKEIKTLMDKSPA